MDKPIDDIAHRNEKYTFLFTVPLQPIYFITLIKLI